MIFIFQQLNIHRRFFTALALHDLVREIPLNAVCKKYNCCRGQLQSLQQSSSTFAGLSKYKFCKILRRKYDVNDFITWFRNGD